MACLSERFYGDDYSGSETGTHGGHGRCAAHNNAQETQCIYSASGAACIHTEEHYDIRAKFTYLPCAKDHLCHFTQILKV